MANREHEIEYLLTARGLELFIRNIQGKITALTSTVFTPFPSEPIPAIPPRPPVKHNLVEPIIRNIGENMPEHSFATHHFAVSDSPYTVTIANTCHSQFVQPHTVNEFSVIDTRKISWIDGIAIRKTMKMINERIATSNKYNLKQYKEALSAWQQAEKEYARQLFEHSALITQNEVDYQQKQQQYEQDLIKWQSDRDVWQSDKERQLTEYNQVLGNAKAKLAALYSSEKIVPLPYRYAEAVCYLYDFLSTSSDDYDIKYALERVDQSEIKQMMGTILQNQSRQILLATVQIMELERLHQDNLEIGVSLDQLHQDNIGIHSAIVESSERVVTSVHETGRVISAEITNIGRTISEGMLTMSNAVQSNNNGRDTALLKDIAENSNVAATATAYLAAKQNTGVFPAQWEAQEFLVHSKKYL